MNLFLIQIINWSEVWALFIPIFFLWRYKNQPRYLNPVIVYVFVALYLNFFIDLVNYADVLKFPDWLQTNTYIYHIHSIIRFILFSIFFIRLKQPFLHWSIRMIPVLFFAFVIINFCFFEHFINYERVSWGVNSKLSSHLLTVEAVLLLAYCLQYYLYRLQDEHAEQRKLPDFWVVTGLFIFIVPCIPIYLFYDRIIENYNDFTRLIWKVPDLCFLIFCIMIAKSFSISKHV